jgi:hypothetical protein
MYKLVDSENDNILYPPSNDKDEPFDVFVDRTIQYFRLNNRENVYPILIGESSEGRIQRLDKDIELMISIVDNHGIQHPDHPKFKERLNILREISYKLKKI